MAESDVIIFCTPLYWYSFPTQIKAAIDKFYSFIIGKKMCLLRNVCFFRVESWKTHMYLTV